MTSNLREQKRLATLAAIEEHATKLVAERGFDDVTIKDICQNAGISRRTFFNYVESKEAAVLGPAPGAVTEADSEHFREHQHRDAVQALLELGYQTFIASELSSDESGEILRCRKAIMRANPQLSLSRMTAFTLTHDSLVRTAAMYLEKYADERKLPHLSPVNEARMMVGLVNAALQLGTKQWMDDRSATTSSFHQYCVAALDNLRQLAIAAAEEPPETPRFDNFGPAPA